MEIHGLILVFSICLVFSRIDCSIYKYENAIRIQRREPQPRSSQDEIKREDEQEDKTSMYDKTWMLLFIYLFVYLFIYLFIFPSIYK